MMKRSLLFCLCSLVAIGSWAQRNEIFSPNIATLKAVRGNAWQDLPVAILGGEPVTISFDELSHDYHRYSYIVEHCESDWTVTEDLFASDFIAAPQSENIIEDYAHSIDTYQPYTHYNFSLPNDDCNIIMSGNYKVTVYDEDNNSTPVFTAYFLVSEETASIQLAYSANTDIDTNARHQQVGMVANLGSLNVTSTTTQLHTVVLQNKQWETAVYNAPSQYRMGNTLRWEHCKELIFKAGTEYFKFETLSPSHPTMGVEHVEWDAVASQWHAFITPDEYAKSYLYDVGAKGSFMIRNSDYYESDTRCDYIQTHFELRAPRQKGAVYINGDWTNGISPAFEMQWNDENNVYETTLLLKQGYYSYHYLLLSPDGTYRGVSPESNFYQTQNEYHALLYFRSPTDRADRLVAVSR